MRIYGNTEPGEAAQRIPLQPGLTLFSRDVNYLRDSALFWPFVLYSVFAVASAFSPGYRHFAIRCAAVAAAALILAKDKLLLFVVGSGFIAIQCAITLILHPWNWAYFTAEIVTLCPLLLAKRYWPNRELKYKLPKEFRLVDALWSITSLGGAALLGYIISPFR